MNLIIESNPVENFLPPFLSEFATTSVEVIDKITKSINNYLKSPEQIESEMFAETINNINGKTDGYIHIHSTDEILSVHMEENY